MRTIDTLLEKYGESHHNLVNKFIHWICVPSIIFSLLALLFCIPFFMERTWWANWAMVLLVFALVYYLRLSVTMFFGFALIGSLMLWGIFSLYVMADYQTGRLVIWALIIFAVAW